MTDDLRELVLARVVVQTVDGPCDCDRCKVAAKDALAVAALVAEECAKACEEIAQHDYQFKDVLHVARGNRADDCAAAIRQCAEGLR